MLGLQPTGGLTAQVGWLGLKVGGQLTLPCIRQMNRVNSRSDFHDDSTINIAWVVLLLYIIIIIIIIIIENRNSEHNGFTDDFGKGLHAQVSK